MVPSPVERFLNGLRSIHELVDADRIQLRSAALPLPRMSGRDRAVGPRLVRHSGEVFARSPQVDAMLRSRSRAGLAIPAHAAGSYALPAPLAQVAAGVLTPVAGRVTANEAKVRLLTDLAADTATVQVQATSYLAGVCSNDLAAKQVIVDDTVAVHGPDLVLDAAGALRSLADSELSNHLGVDVLVVTADRRLLLGVQGSGNLHHAGRVVPAASGSVDQQDLQDAGGDLLGCLVTAARRELAEELGIGTAVADAGTFVVAGLTRKLARGGKPDALVVATLPVPAAQVPGSAEVGSLFSVPVDPVASLPARVVATVGARAAVPVLPLLVEQALPLLPAGM